jgi:nucleotide-binding universal stress UspA family protein
MYKRILVAVENSNADRAVLQHIESLARLTGAELLLVHVADGWAARHFDDLKLRESEEMKDDRAYLERLCIDMNGKGMQCAARLAMGDPATELVKVAAEEQVDHRDVNARPSLHPGPAAWQHRRSCAAPRHRAGSDGARQITALDRRAS